MTLAGENPGLLGNEVETQVAVNYMHYLGDSNFTGVHFGMGYGAHSAWACGIQYLGYGSVTGTLPDGTITGDFAMHDIMLNGVYAYDITERLRGGLNVKMVISSYEHYSDYVRVPFDIQLGWMQRIGESPFQIMASAHDLTKWKMPYYKHSSDGTMESEYKDSFADNLLRHLTFGLQYAPSDKLYIALGYNHKMRTDMSTYRRNFLSGFSAGFGFRVKDFTFDVSYAQPHKGGSSIMFNLACDLQELLRL